MPDNDLRPPEPEDYPSYGSTDSDLPNPGKLVKALDHPAWHRSVGDYNDKYFLSFKHRGGQLPIDVPDTAWAPQYACRLNIRYDTHSDKLWFKPDYHLDRDECGPLPQDLDGIASRVRKEMQSRHHLYEAMRFRMITESNGDELPTKLIKHFRSEYGSLYNLFNRSRDDLLDISGIGTTRVKALLDEPVDLFDPPSWAISCQCPNCGVSYTDPFHPKFERSLEVARQLTYCPACLHDDIPKGMTLGPRDFDPTTTED